MFKNLGLLKKFSVFVCTGGKTEYCGCHRSIPQKNFKLKLFLFGGYIY